MSDNEPQAREVIGLPKFANDSEIAAKNVKLLQKMVSFDTQNPPGNEMPLAEFMEEYILKEDCPYLTTKIIESAPNRGNLIVKVKGSDPDNNPT